MLPIVAFAQVAASAVASAIAPSGGDLVYMKDGSVLRGKIVVTEPTVRAVVEISDGQVVTARWGEIDHIERATPVRKTEGGVVVFAGFGRAGLRLGDLNSHLAAARYTTEPTSAWQVSGMTLVEIGPWVAGLDIGVARSPDREDPRTGRSLTVQALRLGLQGGLALVRRPAFHLLWTVATELGDGAVWIGNVQGTDADTAKSFTGALANGRSNARFEAVQFVLGTYLTAAALLPPSTGSFSFVLGGRVGWQEAFGPATAPSSSPDVQGPTVGLGGPVVELIVGMGSLGGW